jgi:hypothetical protein
MKIWCAPALFGILLAGEAPRAHGGLGDLLSESPMIGIILALLLTSPAHAEGWCNGMHTSNNVCIGSESNVPPVIGPLRLLQRQ